LTSAEDKTARHYF